VFGAGVWAVLGEDKGQEFFAGYLLEQSLSVDNLFVFILVFSYFQTPVDLQRRVLSVGIYSAAGLRLVMILAGAAAIDRFHPVLLAFAAILLFSSYKLFTETEEEEEDLSTNPIVTTCRRLLTVADTYDGEKFFTTLADGTRAATPLLLVLAVIEISDVVFAVDSIPAVFGVTTDPFIVYTSNIFAILSLRSLFAFVADVMTKLHYLEKSVALVLGFIGLKLVIEYFGGEVDTGLSLEVVALLLGGGVVASLVFPRPDKEEEGHEDKEGISNSTSSSSSDRAAVEQVTSLKNGNGSGGGSKAAAEAPRELAGRSMDD
jgi:TerC family integral membrane protein